MHYVTAGVAAAALLLYSVRTAWLFNHGNQVASALLARAGIFLLLAFVCAGFLDLAFADAPFVWRHALILVALCVTVVGHLGLRDQSPT